MSEKWTDTERKSVCEVCAGDLVTVSCVRTAGVPAASASGLRIHLVYQPHYVGLHGRGLYGNRTGPIEFRVDGPTIWCPAPGRILLDGNTAGAEWEFDFLSLRCRERPPGLRDTLTFYRYTGDIPRPYGANTVFASTALSLTASYEGSGPVTFTLSPGDEYPLGAFTRITPPAASTLSFGVCL